MDKIKFPFRVKVNGAYYEPGVIIQVEDADKFIRDGAEVVSRGKGDQPKPQPEETPSLFAEDAPKPQPKRTGRPKKQQ